VEVAGGRRREADADGAGAALGAAGGGGGAGGERPAEVEAAEGARGRVREEAHAQPRRPRQQRARRHLSPSLFLRIAKTRRGSGRGWWIGGGRGGVGSWRPKRDGGPWVWVAHDQRERKTQRAEVRIWFCPETLNHVRLVEKP
jgi:hypothetical protein